MLVRCRQSRPASRRDLVEVSPSLEERGAVCMPRLRSVIGEREHCDLSTCGCEDVDPLMPVLVGEVDAGPAGDAAPSAVLEPRPLRGDPDRGEVSAAWVAHPFRCG